MKISLFSRLFGCYPRLLRDFFPVFLNYFSNFKLTLIICLQINFLNLITKIQKTQTDRNYQKIQKQEKHKHLNNINYKINCIDKCVKFCIIWQPFNSQRFFKIKKNKKKFKKYHFHISYTLDWLTLLINYTKITEFHLFLRAVF